MKHLKHIAIIIFASSFFACSKDNLKDVSDICTQMEDIALMNYCYKNFDANNDGKVSMNEAESVFELGISFHDIYSLKGIEYFKNLRVLYCNRTMITSLDISKNNHLQELNCSGCYGLSSLDISKNTELQDLACIDCSLSTLDLSNNTKLESLHCNNNRLTSLDITFLPYLRRWTELGDVLGFQDGITLIVFDKKEYWGDTNPKNRGNTRWVLR